jgi:hypothetical protein
MSKGGSGVMDDAHAFIGGWNPQYHARRGKSPTRRQEIYEFILVYADEHNGNSPSILEVKKNFRLAYGTVYTHVMKLIAERRIEQIDGKLVVIGAEWNPPAIPLPR